MTEIRSARTADAGRMARLAELKREQYARHAPVFHRPKAGATDAHARFLANLVEDGDTITLVHESDGAVDGFVIGALVAAPPVYDPGGLTLLVDDFMVAEARLWSSVGRALLDRAIAESRPRGAVQTVVVCGPHDEPKRSMLLESGHVVASEWLTKPFAE